MEINAAADHGINVFIFDWYWYDGLPFLEGHLNDGYLKARNNDRVKFYLMWANHDVNLAWDKRNADDAFNGKNNDLIWRGDIDRREFEKIALRWIRKYFSHPSYYKIDGKPVLMIYDLKKLVQGLGGIEQAKDAIDMLERKTKQAGFPGVHLNVMSWMLNNKFLQQVRGVSRPKDLQAFLDGLNCGSASTYCYLHHNEYSEKDGFPSAPIQTLFASMEKYWNSIIKEFPGVLYTPNISMGWDASPRCMQTDKFEYRRYPWTPVFTGNTPTEFQRQLTKAKEFLDIYKPREKIVVINSWNEWTEGSYLLPEKKYGDAYLKAIKAVFGNN
ncbi:Glycosyltransferase WbsX [Chitinophaga ginsengisegetis]|uniref:Glycosyltransferase WbsX n=1 Tax=Chitinophaga ginsengisegetis TaxID=393003 RepID=A0A1T5NKD5_9BACT|nr:glycoside hydrolase family 99-like domain-containing protein [Chitinophaga ginsengisegetis]SKD00865.1 Glycosyltransferase WbsX [Chitinophaga ginsengisegetis]